MPEGGDRTKKHRRIQSPTERELESIAARDRRRPPQPSSDGVPELPSFGDEDTDEFDGHTPVNSTLELAQAHLHPMLVSLWRHIANVEMRSKRRMEATEASALEKRIREVEIDMIDIRGESGDNGKLGNLTGLVKAINDELSKLSGRAWWAITVILGGLGAAAVKLVVIGKSYGELGTTVDNLKSQLERQQTEIFMLRQSRRFTMPADAPGKDSPQ